MRLPTEIEHKVLESIGMADLNEKNIFSHTPRMNELRTQMRRLSNDFARSITSEDKHADAYFAYNFPINLAKAITIAHLLENFYSNIANSTRRLNIIDYGCGEGAGMFGLYHVLRKSKPLSLIGIDASSQMLKKCRRLTDWFKKNDPNLKTKLVKLKISHNIFKKGSKKYDIILFANSLAEIFPRDYIPPKFIEQVLKKTAKHGLLIIIEPALKTYARRLMKLRNEISRRKKYSIILPCRHRNDCALLEVRKQKEWCHQSIIWQPPDYMKILNKGLNREIDYLKFSYLVIAKDVYQKNLDKGFLVISNLLKEKGKKKCFLCTPAGRLELVKLNKSTSHLNDAFDNIMKGDIITIENPVQSKQDYWQVTENTQITISYSHQHLG